jgi:S1-C subfamily serine protease
VTPTPEEPPEEGPDTDNSGSSPFDADAASRGWIDPDDRLWRHPSELAARATKTAGTRPILTRHPRATLLIGAASTLAAVAWTIVLLSPPSDHADLLLGGSGAAEVPVTNLALQGGTVPSAAQTAGHSMVQLRAVTSHGTVSLVGVAVAEGGLVATSANGLSGLRSISMVDSDGHRSRASVVGVDRASDIALVSVPDDVPVAPFADDAALSEGSADMTLSVAPPAANAAADPAATAAVTLHCQYGTVTGIDTEVVGGSAKGMPVITSAATAVNQQAGDPLLNQEGSVIGILYTAGPSSTYLPTQLVLGVADDLRSTGRVVHGWLGVQGDTATGSRGARVAALMPGSPAAGLLQGGDVVVAMGSVPIRSMADLRARLYVMAPETTVGLSVADGSSTHVVDVTLGASP